MIKKRVNTKPNKKGGRRFKIAYKEKSDRVNENDVSSSENMKFKIAYKEKSDRVNENEVGRIW
jgi:hypothetical protein